MVAALPALIIIGSGLGLLAACYVFYFLSKFDPEKDDPFKE